MTAIPVPTPHGSAHDARPRLLARYRCLRDVRSAIETLEAHGVDGDDIALVGPAALAAERTHDRTRTDHAHFALQNVDQLRQFIQQMGVDGTTISHPTTTLEDLFLRIVRENTPAGQSSVGSSPT